MDDRTLLVAIGEALYGLSWKAALAEDLKIDDRSVRRWLQTGLVPPGVWRDLSTLLADRQVEIDALQGEVRGRV